MAAAAAVPEMTLIERALDLEEIDVNLFRSNCASHWKPLGARGVFGGQVVGQALVAATRTVDDHMNVHSLHSYFLLPGDAEVPILYHVERNRDGRSFATRTVSAIQKGKAIFTCQASFQVPEKSSLEHQFPMPNAPAPETLKSQTDRYQDYVNDPKFPSSAKEWLKTLLNEPVPIDMRPVASSDWRATTKVDPARQLIWMRANGTLGDNLRLHQCVSAYASDHRLLSTPLLPHGLVAGMRDPRIKIMASLDHAMWFHEPFRADEWLLYELESPRMVGNRGLSFGRVYNQQGRLVVSVAQEGLIRVDPAAHKAKL